MKIPTYDNTLAIGGVSSSLNNFVQAEGSVLRSNFCTEKLAYRQSAERSTNQKNGYNI